MRGDSDSDGAVIRCSLIEIFALKGCAGRGIEIEIHPQRAISRVGFRGPVASTFRGRTEMSTG